MAAAEGLPEDLVFVDLETTGGSAAYDRITEVGLVRVTNGELAEVWSSLVNPECSIPAYIESFTGIRNDMVRNAPRFAEIASTVLQKLKGAVFVAHNARFDYSFLRSEFQKAQLHFSAQVLCTVKLSRRLFPEFVRHNLDAVMERNGLICETRHRALGDAKVLHDFWIKLRHDVAETRLAAAVQGLLSAHRLPAHLPPGLADEMPEGAGVYRFFDEANTLLYVGKSKTLRDRVLRHFAAADAGPKGRRMTDQVRRVDWVETAGELGAMLREAACIRAQKPMFNQHPKSMSGPYTLRLVPPGLANGTGPPVEAVSMGGSPADLQSFGVFHTAKDARKALGDIARAQRLCRKVLGIEQGEGPCLAYQAGQCKGACAGTEPLILHNTRLQLALSPLKLKAWPFPGRVGLRERNPRRGMPEHMAGADLHIVDHWSYLGTARTEEELAALRSADSNAVFDIDVYRILVRYLAKNPRLDWVDLKRAEWPVS